DLDRMEPFYPLRLLVCDRCFLVQLEDYVTPETLFSNYAYFSSYSDTWLEHCRAYVEAVVSRFGLDATSRIIEVASNDGYLLQYFREKGISVLGIEPAANVAAAAKQRGIPTLVRFFGREAAAALAGEGIQADLLIGNNVLAHVPDLNDFVAGLKVALKPLGVLTMEFPHLVRLMEGNQFDTIYHEHFSYFSFSAARDVFAAHGLEVFDVEQIPTHGGSLRVYVRHTADQSKPIEARVVSLLQEEEQWGVRRLERYRAFGEQVKATKRRLLEFLIQVKDHGRTIAAYGAPAKGNTLLNYCGIRTDFIDYTVDRSPHKQGRYLPGSHIPIYAPQRISETRPDYLLILPWNLKHEIVRQLAYVRAWGGAFIVPIPEVQVIP
ncbi:MAG: class I SAM-dependent methyltransferase, partial [Armatimonadota bacterium]|nr:class I SAM-dependent methyltransferase [Armatimonadota bacterium]